LAACAQVLQASISTAAAITMSNAAATQTFPAPELALGRGSSSKPN